jgi:SAM-dependent methyltransferase
MATHSAFTGSIPEIYETCLVPALFEPYARHVAGLAAAVRPASVLEIAAGTGAVTRHLAELLPRARLVATDLNQAMLDVAAGRVAPGNATFLAADAQALPLEDDSFDLVLTQFGVMFFPDRVAAHREARRVLREGGSYIFTVWNSLDDNPGSRAVHEAVQLVAPEPRTDFLARVPYGYHQPPRIESDLREAGFGHVGIERIDVAHAAGTTELLARGLCLGSPLANELNAHPPRTREEALAEAARTVAALVATGPVAMSALVVTARK